MKMPELPKPKFWVAAPPRGGLALTEAKPSALEEHPVFTAEQLLAYGRAVQEECARVAEQCKEDFLAVRWANEVEWSGKTMAQEIAAAIREKD